jgi:ATP-dependent Clp protease ATP-binding subunit ClpA
VAELEDMLKSKRVKISLTDAARKRLAVKGYDNAFGARPMRRVIRTGLEDAIAHEVLFGDLQKGGVATVDVKDEKAPQSAEDLGLSMTFAPLSAKSTKKKK